MAAISALRFRSIMLRARSTTSAPGVLPVPENPTTAVHRLNGSDHDRDGWMRRPVPIMLAAAASIGVAT
jgi:hypothetical protein